jgi:hypothetical protein
MRKFISSKLVLLAQWLTPGNRMDEILSTGNWKL